MCFIRKYTILFTLLVIIPLSDGISQTPFLKKIPLFPGREDYNVNVVFQDPGGWIWFGTDGKGLFRYDGINLEHFTTADSLADNNITTLSAGEPGVMWIGHKNGKLSKFENNTFSRFRPEEGLGQVEITDIVQDSSGNIWFSTLGEGIYRYDGRYLSNIDTEDGLSDSYVYDIEPGKEGSLWLATDYGVTIYNKDTSSIISMKDGLPDNIIRVVKYGADGKIWLGSEEGGISLIDPADSSITNLKGWEFGAITGFALNLKNELWVSTSRQGIIKLNYDSRETMPVYHQISTSHGLISNRLSSILKDQENNIWVAGRQGVIQALPPVFEFLDKKNGTPFEMVYSFTIDQQGNYWVCGEAGLYKGEANEYGSLTWSNLTELSGLEGQNFISLYMDSEGYIWAGTYGYGVYKFSASGARLLNFQTSNGLYDNNVIHISGNDSLIFFSTLGGGVSTFHTGLNRIINFQDETLNHSYIYATKDDNHGKVWIAGSLGSPAYISDGKVKYLSQTDYNFPQLYGIAIDSSGNAWFNTNDKGILLLLNDTILEYGTGQGITFNEIQSIIFDKLNNLVIISNQGIKFFKPGTGVIMEFSENTGLAYRYPILNSVFTDKQGQIWIGTETGIIKYNPDYLDQISDTPKIFLSTVNLFNNPVTRSRLKFRYNENNFTFKYTGLWFKNPESMTYRYILDGYDLDWTYSSRAQPFTYSKLPPGKYDFKAEVSIDGTTWTGSEDATFSFTVKPPFWKRWWFIAAVVMLILTGVYVYIRMRLAYLKRTKRELEDEVNRRTEEIRTQNEELETQKEEIEAQRDMAQQQRDQIEVQNEEIQASIRYAHRIQSAALPPKSNLDEILGEHFILNKPRDIVSGDFYWAARRNGHIFFAVGDCTGHGVPGAFMSMLGLSALNDIVKSIDQFTASSMLTHLSTRIRESLHQGPSGHETSSSDGMDISLCIYEPASGVLQYAGAYNSLYIINNGEIRNVRADNLSIGSDPAGSKGYTNHVIKSRKGDQLYLFSDGFPDQFGGPRGKKYKYQQFREFLLSIHKEPMERQKWLLDEEIEAWCIGYPKVDDILVMGVKIG